MRYGKTAIYAAAAVVGLVAAMPARAEPPAAIEKVSYADLNLHRASNIDRLRDRVELAVQRVCPAGLAHPSALPEEVMICRSEARREARVQLQALRSEASAEPAMVAAK